MFFKNSSGKKMSFHVSMRNVLLTAQILGFMPIKGVCQAKESKLRFSWLSWRTLYSILYLSGSCFLSYSYLHQTLSGKVKMAYIHKCCLYLMGAFASVLFLLLAKKWAGFVKCWCRVEKAMSTYGWPKNVDKRINRIATAFTILALVEFAMIQALGYIKADTCTKHYHINNETVLLHYIKSKFKPAFSYIPGNIVSVIILMYIHFQTIFSCTFLDVFIMVLSISLAARFKQIKQRVKMVTEAQVRNLTMILIQFFNTLYMTGKLMEVVYICFSFGFLSFRTGCVCVYGAEVNEESRKPLIYLYNLQDAGDNIEVERMILQISTVDIALSGYRFFQLKKVQVLKVIVQYVLLHALLLKQYFDLEPTVSEAVTKYVMHYHYRAVFEYLIEYSLWKAIICEIVNLHMTFVWNYSDLIIILIGAALTYKMRQFNKRLKSVSKLNVNKLNVWSSIRSDYLKLSQLCQSTNDRLSSLIIISFASNIYFILKELYYVLQPMESNIEQAYFFVSFALITMRLICLCLIGSGLHVEWENACALLHSVKATAYNIEVDRFIENVTTLELALTGSNFFKITRGLFLKIVGAILTYELIVIQFGQRLP
ncbi:hypothetical protein NQ315_008162 [Exocentrus adspersus]|uniref:Gustatory receptor n=1 Tax=Exocentrus adspersus TaxID=1586481 RepID=A0AAV8VWD9_9CUCU|nr:hypothetical protein NQ315_008162 [Exocentrus adspersus]